MAFLLKNKTEMESVKISLSGIILGGGGGQDPLLSRIRKNTLRHTLLYEYVVNEKVILGENTMNLTTKNAPFTVFTLAQQQHW